MAPPNAEDLVMEPKVRSITGRRRCVALRLSKLPSGSGPPVNLSEGAGFFTWLVGSPAHVRRLGTAVLRLDRNGSRRAGGDPGHWFTRRACHGRRPRRLRPRLAR